MIKRSKRRLIWNFFVTFLGFFLLAGLATTSSFLLFLSSLSLPLAHIEQFAPYTFFNLLFMSAIFGLIGTLWKKFSVEQPINEINSVLIKIRQGDFSAKLKRRRYPSRYSTIVNNINLMAAELSSLDGLKVSLMSNISHELKTPVSVISNYATLLQDTTLSPEKHSEYAKEIADSAKKMTGLITNILKLNQLENQNIPNDMTFYNVSEQLCETLLDYEDTWEAKNIDLITNIDDNIIIYSNEQLMGIVWNNLLSNAFKFTPENGTITINLHQGSKYTVMEVTDTGCGIPEDQQERIFEKFYQCDTSRATDGNGLGLALVRRIINITNCYIKVESVCGEGTKFTVTIPKKKS